MVLTENITNKLDSLGVRHIGVDRQEYGHDASYRFHTIAAAASEAVRRVFGLPSHVSQINIDRSQHASLEEEK